MDLSLFKLDIDELIDEFTKCGSINFADMKRIWVSRKFSYIFEASPSNNHLAYFMQSLYSHTIGYMLGSGSFSHKLGGLYCLYCLYETQRSKRPFHIYLSLRQVEQLKNLVVDANKEKGVNVNVVSAIVKRMLEKKMFLFGFVDSNENSFTERVNELSQLQNYSLQVAYKRLLGDTQAEHFLHMDMAVELDLQQIRKVSTDYAKAKELAIKEASDLQVDVENIKHISENRELFGDRMEKIVEKWNVQKDMFYQQTGLQQKQQQNVDDEDGEEFDKELDELLSSSP